MRAQLLIFILAVSAIPAWGQKAEKGLLPELKLEEGNEDANQKKAVQSEVMIAKAEAKAIASLNSVLKKKKGTAVEPDLWYRMAELYMRRAKSGRFFDLTRSDDKSPVRFAPPHIREESAVANLRQAISIYNKIENEFPKFHEMDLVFYNNAFSNQQIGNRKGAETIYDRMIKKFPRSMLVPDAHLALGEMAYEAGRFGLALEHFNAVAGYPGSRVYSYGLYKKAWTNYNLKQNEEAIQNLIDVVKFFDPDKEDKPQVSHNLRAEALRDLALFFGEKRSADEAYAFFSKLCKGAELGEAMVNMGKLYDSHSRQKEMNVFLKDFISSNPESPSRIKAELLLIQGNETLKSRPAVVEHMKEAAEVCRPGSKWRKLHPSFSEADCDYDLARVTLDIAKKWWELWLKNKDNKPMAELTESAFGIHLDRENPDKPDTKSHYAYAELLFQQSKFKEASEQYEFVALKSTDTQTAHDAAYSAVVAFEKYLAKTKTQDNVRLKTLCEYYEGKYPQGPQVAQVRYKLGFIAYEMKNYDEAERRLKPLASDKKQDASLRTRSQDLILDILNARQDLNGIRSFSKSLLDQNMPPERKQSLTKIMQEADYASIQKDIEKNPTGKSDSIPRLLAFWKENRQTSPLAKNSLWQAVGIAFSEGRSIEGAELAIEYAKAYPQEDRSIEALRDAAKNYNEQGFLLKAAGTLELLATRLKGDDQNKIYEAVAEIYVLENRKTDAREFLRKLLEKADKKEQGKLYSRLLSTYKGEETSAEYQKLVNKILSSNIEPSASELQLAQAQALFNKGKLTETFNLAKKLVGGDGAAATRARARLLQAQVLEIETTTQSTKTTLERLSLVLSMKTEKLDKAQTAYLASIKISEDANVQLSVLTGLARLYKNYVETVSNPMMKTSLKDDERKALEKELANLVAPIREKQLDIEKKLRDLARQQKTATTDTTDFVSLPINETVKPRINEVAYDKLASYLPKLTQAEGLFVERDQVSSKPNCGNLEDKDLRKTLGELMKMANQCLTAKKFAQVEKISAQIAQLEPKSGLAPYYLSLSAAGFGLREKAVYLIDLAMKKNPDKAFFWYQKALVLGALNERAQANQLMIKAFDERLDAWETKFLHGVVAFSQGDCFSVTDDFNALPSEAMAQFQLLPALSECLAQKGQVDQALALVQKSMSAKKDFALALQWAHLAEVYKMDSKLAIGAYEKARGLTTDADAQNWLNTKLKWLANPQSVTETDSKHVSSKVANSESTGGRQ